MSINAEGSGAGVLHEKQLQDAVSDKQSDKCAQPLPLGTMLIKGMPARGVGDERGWGC